MVLSINVKKPGNYKIDYCFFSKFFTDTLKYSTLFSYLKVPRIDEKLEYPISEAHYLRVNQLLLHWRILNSAGI